MTEPTTATADRDLFGQVVAVLAARKPGSPKKRPKHNPLIPSFGEGPPDKKCGQCDFHYFRVFAKNYPKCEKRGTSGSASTDHSSRYKACGLFQPKSTSQP